MARSGQARLAPVGARSIFRSTAFTSPAADRLPARFTQLDALANRRVRRNALKISQLVDAHAQRDSHFRIEPCESMLANQEIERALGAEAAEDDGRCKPRVTRIELRRLRQKQVACIAAGVRFQKHIEGDLARGGNQPPFYWPHKRLQKKSKPATARR